MLNYFPFFSLFHDFFSIHARYKREIARRLSLAAIAVAYNDSSSGRFQGPFPTRFQATEGSDFITITYDNGESNIELRNSTANWTVGFEVGCLSGYLLYGDYVDE